MGRLDNKVAVITGAASGIGRATARRFAAEGASVVVADFDDQHGPEVATEIGGLFVQVNVADEKSVVAMYDKTAEVYGGIDVLFNNAGISPADDDSILTTGLDAWKRVQDVNLTSVYLCCKYGIPHLQKRGGGSIINTASNQALSGDLSQTAYAAAKGAVVTLTMSVATAFGKQNVRCNCISPGAIQTPALLAACTPEIIEIIEQSNLVPRMGEPEDIANLALFLASDDSSFITGQTIRCDGGQLSHLPHFAYLMATGTTTTKK